MTSGAEYDSTIIDSSVVERDEIFFFKVEM